MKDIEKILAKFIELDRMEEQIDGLNTEYHWSLVIADEKTRDKLKQDYERVAEKNIQYQQLVDRLESQKASLIEKST